MKVDCRSCNRSLSGKRRESSEHQGKDGDGRILETCNKDCSDSTSRGRRGGRAKGMIRNSPLWGRRMDR